MKLRVYDIQDGVTKLGPGTRFVLWTQGCPRRCAGCMSPQSQSFDGGEEVEIASLAKWIVLSKREGITISGGEPFLQAKQLAALIEHVKQQRDIGVILYTGYVLEELHAMQNADVEHLLSLIDLLIDGPYVEALNDGLSLRGSSNQRVIALSPRYEKDLGLYGSEEASAEFFVREDGMILVGVPPKEMLDRLQRFQSDQGGES